MSGTPAGASKLIRGGRTKALLALGCLGVLGAGALIAPPRVPPPAAHAETVSRIVEQQVERRSPSRVFRGVQDAGRDALRFSVSFPAPPRAAIPTYPDFAAPFRENPLPTGFGVLVSAREALTQLAATGGRAELQAQAADGTLVGCRASAYEPETGLLLLELAATAPAPPPPAASAPAPGELVVAAARVEGRDYVAPVFIASIEADRYLIAAAGGVIFPGTPLYTLDGEPLAVIAGGTTRPVAYPVAASLERLRRRMAEGRALPSSIGVRLQPLDGPLGQRLGPGAALLADVLPGGPADAGLRPGDVLLRVSAAEPRGVDDAIAHLARLPAGAKATVAVRRAGREREVEVEPFQALRNPLEDAPRPPPEGAPLASALFHTRALRAAGVPRHASVLAIEGSVPIPAQAAAKLLRRRPAPWLVYLQDGTRRFFALIADGA